ncbi:MAG: hypothetical protein OXG97_11060, partial [Candidatus Poribacteria bacterium]|nr:hypothetical protein [Candidatus Poribacteria bacterium]
MLKDPIIEEIHRIRDEWAASFQYDLRALCEDIKRQEKRDFLTDDEGNFVIDPRLKSGASAVLKRRKHLWFSEADYSLQRRYLQ